MIVDYDPLSDEAMVDPQRLYALLREHDPVHYMDRYDAWALASFDSVWQACTDGESFSVRRGQTPNQILLGEPAMNLTFPELDPPEHRLRKRILSPSYTREAARLDEPTIRSIARQVLEPLLDGDGFDAYDDYTSRVTSRFACHKAGIPEADAEQVRTWLRRSMDRSPGQRGTTPENQQPMGELFGYFQTLIGTCRDDPAQAGGLLAELLDARIDGEPLDDIQIAAELHTLIVTGSETTELASAGALHHLERNPEQKAEVLAHPSLGGAAFAETVRYDHPTDILCRVVRRDTEVCGCPLREGQGVLLLWGSANRDEREYPDADRFDIHRRYERSLLFGHGQHKCIGEHLGMRMGAIILEELFGSIRHFDVDLTGSRRRRGEFLKGFNFVPTTFERR